MIRLDLIGLAVYDILIVVCWIILLIARGLKPSQFKKMYTRVLVVFNIVAVLLVELAGALAGSGSARSAVAGKIRSKHPAPGLEAGDAVVPDTAMHPPAVQHHQRRASARSLDVKFLCQCRFTKAREAESASSRLSTSDGSWMADSVTRRREEPAGTVGGRMAVTQNPRWNNSLLSRSAAAASPTRMG